jgi:hypothetical protein
MAEIRPFPSANFQESDEAKPSAMHWKIMFISGMGMKAEAFVGEKQPWGGLLATQESLHRK